MKKTALLLLSLYSGLVHAQQLKAPVGVRPCCAFGVDLKAQLGSVPVPFFSLENVLSSSEVGTHHYNDGSESVSGSLLGLNEEANGIIFTEQGGFIDTAHVRDTADYTYYLFTLNQHYLGRAAHLDLPEELRVRRIRWYEQKKQLIEKEKLERSAQAAALTAFRLAQWHEIAQWFGMVSVSGFKELASAFSSEDLYSNMLGAKLAKQVLLDNPELDQTGFSKAMDTAFKQALKDLKAQSKAVTKEKIQQLDGDWWDSSRRLPDKWVVRFRDYHMALKLTPNYSGANHELSLSATFADQLPIDQWMSVEFRATDNEEAFSSLPKSLSAKSVWTPNDYQQISDFARTSDAHSIPPLK
ncbi:DUF4056 domain-containing protein [Vibrio parahaemolyticus]|uniref:DUF4056 domain-containing protein n=1 Tax=Vibrio parahaemolyticus TaxID=670 RepID=UPI0004D96BEE|nr:DUF4056 domain-containing protein [Vibrio parahaemolyticus]KIT38592.1 hypothetical protein H331_10350 [Vibrio parahaemolyticus 3644]KIT56666.1 hypothetical protein H336_20685 [Vibrio parahaemolyticus EN9701072]EGQ7681574.1 DUF4056 domain-containing protein [Vibrio parahaemolyticus]EGQ7822440.1 DUF4056 domain-containing protein [Vibrio parahaemolyticus]EGQ8080987.1 DUF4056 domain-containing protein [Vibrio parahaemolyticus]